MPENVLSTVLRKSSSRQESDEFELEYKDGYVQRKDSKMTKFSTTVAYIEPPPRRDSIWSLGAGNSQPSSPIRKAFSTESLKRTRFSDTVEVREEPPMPSS